MNQYQHLYPTGLTDSQPTFDGLTYEPLYDVPYGANSGGPNEAPNENASAPNVNACGPNENPCFPSLNTYGPKDNAYAFNNNAYGPNQNPNAPNEDTSAPFQNIAGLGYANASGPLFPAAFDTLSITGGDTPYPTVSGPMYPAASDAEYPVTSSNLPLSPNDSSDSSTASTTAVATPIMPKLKLILPAPAVLAGWSKPPAKKSKKNHRERYIPSKMPKVGGHGVWTPYRRSRLFEYIIDKGLKTADLEVIAKELNMNVDHVKDQLKDKRSNLRKEVLDWLYGGRRNM